MSTQEICVGLKAKKIFFQCTSDSRKFCTTIDNCSLMIMRLISVKQSKQVHSLPVSKPCFQKQQQAMSHIYLRLVTLVKSHHRPSQ